MITTVADFLEEFRKYALTTIAENEKDVIHRPTIGNIFEGLTSSILSKAIFEGLNLKIVQKSFIYNDSGKVSSEIDCMLVAGDGIQISFTDQYKYHIKDVIAVFQVKKNLYANDIEDSYQNLRSVIEVSEPRQPEPFVGMLQRDAYKLLTSKEIPTEQRRESFTDRENIIYHFLLMEAFYPLRIVIGYYGYKDEFTFREGFVTKLEEIAKVGPVKGYSPFSFPNLFICGNNTVLKNNGMPFGVPFLKQDFYWPILTTSNEKAMYYLLELIWTRLSYKFEISSEIFGDDFQKDPTHPFLSCKEKKVGEDSWGWEYTYHTLSRKELNRPLITVDWRPSEINKVKYSILMRLTKLGKIDIHNDSQLLEFLKKEKTELSQLIKELEEERLIYIDEGKMGLLVDDLLMLFDPNGKIYAGENKSGEMTNYMSKQKTKQL